ncbi:hypothetical protein BDF14DRAFT_1743260 [Spinellus fusiger]|nr:hypothetical protein BDF14DRAFT_1743260 [Spinellus fusiger]
MSSLNPSVQERFSRDTYDQCNLSLDQQKKIAAAQAAAAAEVRRSPRSTYTPTSSSLYVGDLDPSVQESTLHEIFGKVCSVESIRICRDAITRRSLGYAYVNFRTQEDGDRALSALNYAVIKGKQCRIMWSQRDPSKRKAGSSNVFVKNLNPQVTTKELHDTFAQYGAILSCKVVLDETGASKGYGFIHYETEQSADEAIRQTNGLSLQGKAIYVGYYMSKRERDSKAENAKQHFTNIFVKNLLMDITEDELRTHFEVFGPIMSVAIQRDEFGVSKEHGFINYERHEDAERAVKEMHDTVFLGKRLFVSRAQKKSEREDELRKQHEQAKMDKLAKYQGVNLYVKNLSDDLDDNALCEEFARFGSITSAKIMKDEKTGISKGFGFVCFTSADDATRAVAEMNGSMLSCKPIYVSLAQKKEERRHQLEAQRQQAQMNLPPVNNYIASPAMYYGNNTTTNYSIPIMPPPRPPRWTSPPVQSVQLPLEAKTSPPVSAQPVCAQVSTSPQAVQAQEKASVKTEPQTLTVAILANMSPDVQRQTLGERIYHTVHTKYPSISGKVTGMLLELRQEELIYLISNQHALLSKASEAVAVLEKTRSIKT